MSQLAEKLKASGVKVVQVPTKQSGLFIPAKYLPLDGDGAFVQTYRFKSAKEAKGAAGTVDADGYVLGATPERSINVNWTGWPAFFRSGDLVVIFVTEKGKANAARDKRVYSALKSVLRRSVHRGQHATAVGCTRAERPPRRVPRRQPVPPPRPAPATSAATRASSRRPGTVEDGMMGGWKPSPIVSAFAQ